jgi:hypothetical protein
VVGFGDGGAWISYGRTDSTFTPPGLEVRDFGTAQGWRVDQHPRAVADVTGDGRADIVGFGHRGIHVARSIPIPPRNINFYAAALEVADLGVAQGRRVDRHPRALADVTGDGVETVLQNPRAHPRSVSHRSSKVTGQRSGQLHRPDRSVAPAVTVTRCRSGHRQKDDHHGRIRGSRRPHLVTTRDAARSVEP